MKRSMAQHRDPATITNFNRYKRRNYINIGLIIFAVIFVYIIICVILYFRSNPLSGYEVRVGSLSVNNVYRGIALRNESVVTADDNGYINYFVSEGQRVAVGNLIYAVDETGSLRSSLEATVGNSGSSLTDDDLKELRAGAITFQSNYDPSDFSSVYDFKYKVNASVLQMESSAVWSTLNSLSAEDSALVNLKYAGQSGIITYFIDGYEEKSAESLVMDDFDEVAYEKTPLVGVDLVSAGDPVYKVIGSDDWTLVAPIDEERANNITKNEITTCNVKFLQDQYTTRATCSLFFGTDGNQYLKLNFTSNMINYCSDRFLDVELLLDTEKGLKIPNSSIVEKNFFLIPKAYVLNADSVDHASVLRRAFTEAGTETTESIIVQVYGETPGETDSPEDDYYYIDDSALNIGDILYKIDSTDTETVSKQASLVGVYNINKGYADFRQITVLYSNEAYSIVKSNTAYGLNEYDYIALEAASVAENDFIYE
ncbi:MAG: hypothetical protein K5682_02160 [Lachnospiraceae bacterium]|nr:hypothetical protein [Lachnospiraceae bacterium]